MTQVPSRWLFACMVAGLVSMLGSVSWRAAAQEPPANTAAVSSQPDGLMATGRPGISLTNTMAFRFENVTVDRILTEMSAHFGFIITKTDSIPNRVTIEVPQPVHADEALLLLNNVLVPLGYATLETYTGIGMDARTSLRVAGLAEVKKANIPVRVSGQPEEVPLNNNVITQIIPLQNLDAVRLRSDLAPLISADADVTANAASNVIIVTDTAAKIHRLVQMTSALDQLAGQRPKPAPAAAGSSLPPGMTVVSGPYVGPMANGAYRHGIPGRGEVLAARAAIEAPADGILKTIRATDGAEVKAGQVLAELDGQGEQAELATAQARLELARAELARIEQAGAPHDVAVAQAQVVAAQAVVHRCQVALLALQIKAPFDGVLTRVDFRPGQSVHAGTALTEVVGKEELKLAFTPPSLPGSAEIGVGTKFTFRIAETNYDCEVTYVPPQGAREQDLALRARFIGSTDRLKPGMQGTILDVGMEDGKIEN